MKTIFVLLMLFLAIGLVIRTYNIKARLLLIAVIGSMVLYLYLT